MNDNPPPPPPRLAAFAERNAEASVTENADSVTVAKPWGDDSVEFDIPHASSDVFDALNNVRLPPRLTALWHTDSNDIEFIFGAIPATSDLESRVFEIINADSRLKCEYADSSSRLQALAGVVSPAGPTKSEHRNLLTVRTFTRVQEHITDGSLALRSFWIRGYTGTEAELIETCRQVNFYARYFDRESPRIVIHEIDTENSHESVRYPSNNFPAEIAVRNLDPYLLGLWESAADAKGVIQRYLYCYQIFEYSAFYYIREDLRNQVRRSLVAPDLSGRVDSICNEMIELFTADKKDTPEKIIEIVQRAVDPQLLWSHIDAHRDSFSQEIEFDSGFRIPALIQDNWQYDDFRAAWIPRIPDTLRKLRNAIVHAREQRMSRCIPPTTANQRLLQPWNDLIMTCAMQLIVYENALGTQ